MLAGTVAGCASFERDTRLEACWSGRHGNVASETLELPAVQVAQRYALDLHAHPELAADQLVFVVVYGNGAVIPKAIGENVVNFTRAQAMCVWFNEGNVAFYEVAVGEGD